MDLHTLLFELFPANEHYQVSPSSSASQNLLTGREELEQQVL